MTDIDKQELIGALKKLMEFVNAIPTTPQGCAHCAHCDDEHICNAAEPPQEIPDHVIEVGCKRFSWDGIPF